MIGCISSWRSRGQCANPSAHLFRPVRVGFKTTRPTNGPRYPVRHLSVRNAAICAAVKRRSYNTTVQTRPIGRESQVRAGPWRCTTRRGYFGRVGVKASGGRFSRSVQSARHLCSRARRPLGLGAGFGHETSATSAGIRVKAFARTRNISAASKPTDPQLGASRCNGKFAQADRWRQIG